VVQHVIDLKNFVAMYSKSEVQLKSDRSKIPTNWTTGPEQENWLAWSTIM